MATRSLALSILLLLVAIVEASDSVWDSSSSAPWYNPWNNHASENDWRSFWQSKKSSPKRSPPPPPPPKKKSYSYGQSLSASATPSAMQFMGAQNAARLSLGLHPLRWDPKLESYARWWASQRQRGGCTLQHSGGQYGENIFWGSGKAWSPSEASQAWVSERKWYNYAANSCAGGQQCGHYTQIVWKGSTRIGCARVTCSSGDVFMTCNYDPPGNYIGERPY